MSRQGKSLLELLIVVAIIGVLAGLVLAAIQRIRESALLVRSENNLRQIGMAQSAYASQNEDRLPAVVEDNTITPSLLQPRPKYLFRELLPFVEQQALYDVLQNPKLMTPQVAERLRASRVETFLNPLDRSQGVTIETFGFTEGFVDISSYAANAMIFESASVTPARVSDGLSNTIFFTEHYGWRCGSAEFHFLSAFSSPRPDGTVDPRTNSPVKPTRPTFADADCGDFCPGEPGSPAKPRVPLAIFQSRVPIEACDPRLPNASSARGLQVLMGDGSVRIVRPSISNLVFWAAVTPSGGEQEVLD